MCDATGVAISAAGPDVVTTVIPAAAAAATGSAVAQLGNGIEVTTVSSSSLLSAEELSMVSKFKGAGGSKVKGVAAVAPAVTGVDALEAGMVGGAGATTGATTTTGARVQNAAAWFISRLDTLATTLGEN